MELAITTPALLFPAISLLMISYKTRFLHLANLARSLHAPKAGVPESTVLQQINQCHRGARLGEGFCSGEPHAGADPGDKCDFVLKRQDEFLFHIVYPGFL